MTDARLEDGQIAKRARLVGSCFYMDATHWVWPSLARGRNITCHIFQRERRRFRFTAQANCAIGFDDSLPKMEPMMRFNLVSTAVLATCMATSAFAADLPSRVPRRQHRSSTFPRSPGPASMSVLTPASVGLTRATSSSRPDSATSEPDRRRRRRRFVGGGQIGYNFQSGAFVYGLETDIQYADRAATCHVGTLHLVGGHRRR